MANHIHYVLNLNVLHLIDLLSLNHLNIPNVNQSKYLGIVINETNCNTDLKRQICKLYVNVNNYDHKEIF